MIIECIKEGFYLANKNLQLVLIRIIASLINLVSMIIFLGVPLLMAMKYLEIDMAGAQDMYLTILQNPFDFISRYLALILLSLVSLTGHLLFASILFLYVLGGSLGVLRTAAANLYYRFSLSEFFREAGKNFFPLMWLVSTVLAVLTVLVVVCLIIGGVVFSVVHTSSGAGTTAEVFFHSFLSMSALVFGVLILVAASVFYLYSIVVSVYEKTGTADSMKRAYRFLTSRPAGALHCIVLFAGAIALQTGILFLKVPFQIMPIMGALFIIAVALFSAVFQSYITVVVWASLLAYYKKATACPGHADSLDR